MTMQKEKSGGVSTMDPCHWSGRTENDEEEMEEDEDEEKRTTRMISLTPLSLINL